MRQSPFKFLDSYTSEDRDIFFGRDQEITELYRKVFESKILLVYGVSGTGKSSLVNCGLASRFDESDWLPVNIRRGNNITESLNDAISRQAISPLKKGMSVTEKLQSIYLDHFKPVYLIFDQFEELFIFGIQDERTEFIRILKDIARSKSQCRIILVIREEFLAGVTEFEEDLPEIFHNRFRVEKMKRTNAISAVEGPCKVFGIETEQGFSEELVDKLIPSGQEIELTYLQIYLDRIFRLVVANQPGTRNPAPGTNNIRFLKDLLTKAGSVSDLLGQFLEEQIREMEDPEKGMSILKSFVSVQGTKRQMNEEQILDSISSFGSKLTEPDLLKYLTKFVDLRILRERDEAGHFELRHDALAGKIYEKFTALEKDIIDARQFIDNAYSDYGKRGKLLTVDDLKYIAPYEDKLFLNKPTEAFIERSKKQIQRTKIRRRNIAVTATIALLVIFAGFTFWALRERQKSDIEKNKALAVKYNLIASKTAEQDPTIAIRLAEYGYILDSSDKEILKNIEEIYFHNTFYRIVVKKEKDFLRATALSDNGRYVLISSNQGNPQLWDLKGNLIKTLNTKDEIVALSYNGNKILTISSDPSKRISMWDSSGILIKDIICSAPVSFVNFLHDDERILVNYTNGTFAILNESGEQLRVLDTDKNKTNIASFSDNGKTLLLTASQGPIYLFDNEGNRMKKILLNADNSLYINNVIFGPQENTIITLSSGDVKLWDLNGNMISSFFDNWGLNGNIISSFNDNRYISAIAYSSYLNIIIAGTNDGYIQYWDTEGHLIQSNRSPSNFINSLKCYDTGKELITISSDEIMSWDIAGLQVSILSRSTSKLSKLYSFAASPDGKTFITGHEDKKTCIWDSYGNIKEIIQDQSSTRIAGGGFAISAGIYAKMVSRLVRSIAFSPGCDTIAIGSDDKTIGLWKISGDKISDFSIPDGYVNNLFFSPGGQSLLISNFVPKQVFRTESFLSTKGLIDTTIGYVQNERNILLYDIRKRTIRQLYSYTLDQKPSPFSESFCFSADGKRIILQQNKNIFVWDLQGNLLSLYKSIFPENTIGTEAIACCADGSKFISGCKNGEAILWDSQGNKLATLISGDIYETVSVGFSYDGKLVITSVSDKARIYNQSGKLLLALVHGDVINSAKFSPDNEKILTQSDLTVKLWNKEGILIQSITNGQSKIVNTKFSNDGKILFVAFEDGTLIRYDLKPAYQRFHLDNDYQELSIQNKVEYDILSIDDVLKSDNLSDLYNVGDFLVGKSLNVPDSADKINLLLNIEKLYLKAARLDTLISQSYIKLYELSIQKDFILDKNGNERSEKYFGLMLKAKDFKNIFTLANYFYIRGSTSEDNKNILNNSSKAILFFEKMFEKFPSKSERFKRLAADCYNTIGWCDLFVNEYNSALKAIQRGIELDPSNPYLRTNLPLCYLLSDKYELAKSFYLEYKDKPWTASSKFKTCKEAFLSDLTTLEKAGITHPDFEKVKELLK
jgi:WD40 repeat protein